MARVSGKILRAAGAFRALASCAMLFVTGAASAADLPSTKEPALAPAVDAFNPFFLKAGFTYAYNQSKSTISAQNPAYVLGHGPTTFYPAGFGATIGDIATVGFEAGYFVTSNISLNVSTGVPYYVKDKAQGSSNPIVPNGTTLAKIVPSLVPITAVYHLSNFGGLSPYAGVGIAPGFSLGQQNAFLNNVKVGGSVGLVLQAGADYMLDKHWGLSFDVKKVFAYVDARATGMNLPVFGAVPVASAQHVRFQPWLFSTGLVYRFGAPEQAVIAKY